MTHLAKSLSTNLGNWSGLWNFFRHEVLYLMWALMEVSIIAPVFLAFAPWSIFWDPGLVVVWLTLLMLIPFNLSRIFGLLKVPLEKQRLFLALGLIFTLILAWRIMLFDQPSWIDTSWLADFIKFIGLEDNPFRTRILLLFLGVSFVWWRGVALVGRSVDIGEIGFRMRLELLLLIFFVAGLAATQLNQPVTPFILLFFFSSLVAIVMTRVEQLERDRSGQSFPLGIRWFIAIIFSAALIVLTIGILSAFVSGQAINDVVGWFSPLWSALSFTATAAIALISFLSLPFLYVLEWLLQFIINLIRPGLGLVLEQIEITTETPFATPQSQELVEAAEKTFQLPRDLLTILVMLALILLVTLSLSRLIRVASQPADRESEGINPFSGLAGIKPPGLGRRLLDQFGSLRRRRTAATIRQIYQELCEFAAAQGYPRTIDQTPSEYLETLIEAWPENNVETRLITDAYNRVRYGEIPEEPIELQQIQAAWQKLASTPPAPLIVERR